MTRTKIVAVVFILLISLVLRFHNYAIYPQRGATSDEYTYAFLGVSLLKDQIPISWSSFSAYKNREDLTINNLYFPIVWPYFDHPPLHGLLIGGWAILFGEDSFTKITLGTIRIVPIILATVSSILLFLLAESLYSYKVAIWSLLIYSTTTIFVMNNRVAVAENLISVFFLSAAYLIHKFPKRINYKKAILVGSICGLSLLTKILGIGAFFIALYLLISEKVKKKLIVVFCFAFLLFVGLLLGYAFYYDWDLFWQIQFLQGVRAIGPQTFLLLTQDPVIVNKVFYDGWYFIGFFSLFFSFFDYKKNKFIVIPFIIYFLLLLVSMTREGHSGWYMIPIFPFMSIAIGQLLRQIIDKASFLFIVFLLFVGMSEIHLLYEVPFGLNQFRFRLLMVLLFVPFLAVYLTGKKKLIRNFCNIFFYLFIIGNFVITFYYVHPS